MGYISFRNFEFFFFQKVLYLFSDDLTTQRILQLGHHVQSSKLFSYKNERSSILFMDKYFGSNNRKKMFIISFSCKMIIFLSNLQNSYI